MDKKTVRFGIVGCGMIAQFHMRAIKNAGKQAVAVACCASNEASARAFAVRYGLAAFDTLDAMLASSEVDAVCLCTPSGLHTAQAIQAMRAGKHVVVEKPMSLTMEEADRLISTAEETGLKVCVISQFRFQPAIQAVKRALDAGQFGKVTSARLSMPYYRSPEYYKSSGWRGTWAMDGGGALMNQGIHGVDVFRYLLGPVCRIWGISRTLFHDIEVEDTATAALEFESGALGVLEGTTACYPGYPRTMEIRGTSGSVLLEEDSILRWDLPCPCPLPVGKSAKGSAFARPEDISAEGHTRQLCNFIDAVLHDKPLMLDAVGGRAALEIILAVYRSSRTGQPVELFKRAAADQA